MQSRQAVQDMLQHGQTLRRREAVTSDAENIESDSDESGREQMIHESTSRKVTLEDMEGNFSEDEPVEKVVDSEVENNLDEVMNARADSERNESPQRQKAQNNLQINPSQYLVVETQRTAAAANDDGEAKVALAFAGDDDVVAEFAAEKQRVVERERPKDIDLRLPGWGEWSGPGIKPRQRKKRSAILFAVLLTRTGHARTRTRTKPTRTRTRTRLARTRTSLTVTYCKLQLNLQSLSSNNNEHKAKVHNI